MSETKIQNAVIEKAVITTENGFLDVWLHLNYGCSGQGFGGWSLYLPKSWTHHNKLSFAGHHIFRCMEIAGVSKWNDIIGKTIRVKGTYAHIDSIGHIINDDWFCPEEDYKKNDHA